MELRHLRYFVAVAEERHVTRAAARLGVQQPQCSQEVLALETELERQLFRRKPRGVELTPAGEAFLAEARIVLERAEHAVLAARRAARGEAGRLGLGFTSSASFHPLVPRVSRDVRETSPLVTLSREEAGTAELVEGLRAGRIHAAFGRSPIGPAADLTVHSLLGEEMVAALPSGHRLAAGTKSRLPLSALEGETFILYRRPLGPGLYDAIIAACQRAGYSPRIGQEAPRMLATLSLVAAGLGVTLIPQSMRLMQVHGVTYRSLDRASGPVAPLNLAYRRAETAPAACRFIALARRIAR